METPESPESNRFISNAQKFLDKIEVIRVKKNDATLSFDVTTLFTSANLKPEENTRTSSRLNEL